MQPWGIISWHDRWYLGGFDLDREAPRIFRLSRVQGDVETTGEPGSYEVPEGTDMTKVAAALFPAKPDSLAVLRVRAGRGQSLRRLANASTPGRRRARRDRGAVRLGVGPRVGGRVLRR